VSAERATYLDASAIVKLVAEEPESHALLQFLGQRGSVVSSAVARTEVGRSLLRLGPEFAARGDEVLAHIDLVHVGDEILRAAAHLHPAELRAVNAIHLATAQRLGEDVAVVVTYDGRMAAAAQILGWKVVAPA
jgi:uncharacterized protein